MKRVAQILALSLLFGVLILILTVRSHGQLGGVQQPIFSNPASEGFAPDSIQGLAYWWVASDLPANLPVTNGWIDRIQGLALTNGNLAVCPTNAADALSVGFDGSTFLTNVSFTISSSLKECTVLIAKRTIGNGIRALFGGTSVGYVYDNYVTAATDWGHYGAVNWKCGEKIPTNAWHTMIVVHTNGANWTSYTNNILSSITANANVEPLTMTGVANRTAQRHVGFIAELMIYTNGLSATDRTNIQNYAQITYSFSP